MCIRDRSAGQGVTSITDSPNVKDLVEKLKEEFVEAVKDQQNLLEKFS